MSTNDAQIESILAKVALPEPTPEIPLANCKRLEDVKRTAYHTARAKGLSAEDAEIAGKTAYDIEVYLILRDATPEPVQAPPKEAPPAPPVEWVPTPMPRPTTPSMPNIAAGAMDVAGANRSRRDFDAMIAAGFAPAATVYERGSRVDSTGVSNARRSRVDHDRKPLVVDAASELIGKIRREERRILVASPGAGCSGYKTLDRNRRERVYWFVEKAINSIFDKEMQNVVEKFRKTVRERFDAKLAADVVETLKSAIGLR